MTTVTVVPVAANGTMHSGSDDPCRGTAAYSRYLPPDRGLRAQPDVNNLYGPKKQVGAREGMPCTLCGVLTTDRKPMCLAHITHMPQVVAIHQELMRRADQDADVRAGGAPQPHRVSEVASALQILGGGPAGVAVGVWHLMNELHSDMDTVLAYLTAMEKEGAVTITSRYDGGHGMFRHSVQLR